MKQKHTRQKSANRKQSPVHNTWSVDYFKKMKAWQEFLKGPELVTSSRRTQAIRQNEVVLNKPNMIQKFLGRIGMRK